MKPDNALLILRKVFISRNDKILKVAIAVSVMSGI
jgi:hypothetical protein